MKPQKLSILFPYSLLANPRKVGLVLKQQPFVFSFIKPGGWGHQRIKGGAKFSIFIKKNKKLDN